MQLRSDKAPASYARRGFVFSGSTAVAPAFVPQLLRNKAVAGAIHGDSLDFGRCPLASVC
jgi:hypothetical protein